MIYEQPGKTGALVNFKTRYDNYIGGEWQAPVKGRYMENSSPVNGAVFCEVPRSDEQDVDLAVQAAQKAFETWGKTPAAQRANVMLRIADRIEQNIEMLAVAETWDNGKAVRETLAADIPLVVDHFRYFAGAIRAQEGSAAEIDSRTAVYHFKEPIGVVGQIIPWNFPLLMAAWKLAPAIAAGNTVILKPSSTTSASVLEFAKLFNDVLPAGVVNIVTGGGSTTGQYLQEHKGLDKLAFTGSTAVGRHIGISAAKNLIPSTLELGGKSANIFFEDMDMDQALEGVQLGILFNQGEVCSAGSRILVQESVYDEFIEAVKEEFKKVKVGMPWEDGVQMGPQVNEKQLKTIHEYVEIGKKEGAEVIVGGDRYQGGDLSKGAFYQPTLLKATNDMRVAQEEIFGPVGTVITFKDAEEAIQIANDSEYGLAGGVFTSNINTALNVSRGIRTGRVWVNTYASFEAGAPFGGYKNSGIGRETHKMMLDAYTQPKNIYINLAEGRKGMY